MDTGDAMTQAMGRRRRLSRVEREHVWALWQTGVPLEVISAALGSAPSTVYGEVRVHGGIAPAARRRAARTLDLRDRQLLAQWGVGAREGVSVREAARRLGRAPSTVSREIRRNGQRIATTRRYDATAADARAWQRACRPKRCRLA